MASRTTTSIGMGVTVTVLGALLLAAFITSVILYGGKQRAEKELAEKIADEREVITVGQRSSDRVQTLLSQKDRGTTLFEYLDESLQTTMRRVLGTPQASVADLTTALEGVDGAESASLMGVIDQRNAQISRLRRQLADADAARAAAESDLQAEVARVERLREEHEQTVAALNAELDQYKQDVEEYRSSVDTTLTQNNERVESIRRAAAQRESSLEARIAGLEEENLVLSGTLAQLRNELKGSRSTGTDEYALVDGRVIDSNRSERQVFLSLGRSDRLRVGMTFEVYDSATSIRPDDDGNYPAGKAAVEVIRINEGSSVARIIRENPRSPIVAGDVIANAVYDPKKQYTFVVFGDFDTNYDGQPTPDERNRIVGLISDWGGTIKNDLDGYTDFLVLGERPVLPPEPSPDAPIAVVRAFLDKRQAVNEYDRLFQTAQQTSIPILNQNRLFTLTGLSGQR